MFGSRCIVSPTVIWTVTSDHSESHIHSHTHSGLLLNRHTHQGSDVGDGLRRIHGARSLSVSSAQSTVQSQSGSDCNELRIQSLRFCESFKLRLCSLKREFETQCKRIMYYVFLKCLSRKNCTSSSERIFIWSFKKLTN